MQYSLVIAFALVAAGCASAAGPSSQQPAPEQQREGQQQRRGARPYSEVITARAVTDSGGIIVHKVDEKWFFELPDSLLGRDFLQIGRAHV